MSTRYDHPDWLASIRFNITETWLRDSSDHTDISGYNFVHNPRKDRKGGGEGLYLVDNFDFKC